MNLIGHLVNYKESSVFIEKRDAKLAVKTSAGNKTDALKQDLKNYKDDILSLYEKLGITSNKQLAPTSFSQQRLWYVDELQGSENYNIVDYFSIHDAIDVPAFNQSLNKMVERHESLRTTFVESHGQVYQVINHVKDCSIEAHDFRALSKEEAFKKAQIVLDASSEYQFDHEKEFMFKMDLCLISDKESYIIVNIHHIVFDGWSQKLFKKEFLSLYNYYLSGSTGEFPLQELEYQFADYAHWEKGHFTGEVLEKHIHYWEQQLSGIPDIHNLPLDRPRANVPTFHGNSLDSTVDKEVILKFKEVCSQSNVSLFMGLNAVFACFLGRISGEDDVVFATPFANRGFSEFSSVVGFFVSTLILRYNLSPNATFASFLKESKQICLDAYAHHNVPFEKIVNKLNIKRSTSYSPIFQIMFAVETFEGMLGNNQSNHQNAGKPDVTVGRAKFDLNLACLIYDDCARFCWTYNKDLFDQSTIQVMAQCFNILLEQITAMPDSKISSYRLWDSSESDKAGQLNSEVESALSYPSVIQQFEQLANTMPDNAALISESANIGYADLNAKVNQLSHYLLNALPGKALQNGSLRKDAVPVILYLDSSEALVVSVYAVLKAGCHFICIDKNHPVSRVAEISQTTQAKCIITDTELKAELPDDTMVLNLYSDTTLASIQTMPSDNPSITISGDDLAYISFTSGSTGKPKGVMVSHDNLSAYLKHSQEEYLFCAEDNILQFSSISFDIFIEELFGALCYGATLCIPQQAVQSDIALFLDYIQRQQISVISLPTSFFHLLCENISMISDGILDSLRLVVIGGEKLSIHLYHKWQQLGLTQIKVLNTYGPTETTVVATAFDLANLAADCSNVPIGKPLTNVGCYILDKHGHICPTGIKGELCISGPLVSKGYFGDEQLTRQQFVSIPSVDATHTLYKTGDLARYLPDGNIEFSGRVDEQVKVRGFRVEPAEVECHISALDYVDSSLVLSQKNQVDDTILVAYVKHGQPEALTNDEGKNDTIRDLRRDLAAVLPAYMLPGVFLFIEEWPLTTNGKIDKRKLPEFRLDASDAENTDTGTETEELLKQIWSQLLNIAPGQLTLSANFFELGGHSLLAIRMISSIREEFNVELTIKEVINYQVLNSLAEYIDGILLGDVLGEETDHTLADDEVELEI